MVSTPPKKSLRDSTLSSRRERGPTDRDRSLASGRLTPAVDWSLGRMNRHGQSHSAVARCHTYDPRKPKWVTRSNSLEDDWSLLGPNREVRMPMDFFAEASFQRVLDRRI